MRDVAGNLHADNCSKSTWAFLHEMLHLLPFPPPLECSSYNLWVVPKIPSVVQIHVIVVGKIRGIPHLGTPLSPQWDISIWRIIIFVHLTRHRFQTDSFWSSNTAIIMDMLNSGFLWEKVDSCCTVSNGKDMESDHYIRLIENETYIGVNTWVSSWPVRKWNQLLSLVPSLTTPMCTVAWERPMLFPEERVQSRVGTPWLIALRESTPGFCQWCSLSIIPSLGLGVNASNLV
jgi:hypothetical protein